MTSLRSSCHRWWRYLIRGLFPVLIGSTGALAAQTPANREVYLDRAGVVRWKDDRSEVALFGANYVLTTASDYRAAGYLHADRKRMIVDDMAQFARLGWDGIRLTFWGDWEASDSAGNLLHNEHLDLLDWLIARARERGIYMLLSPIQLYGSNWPDALGDTTEPGFGRRFGKERMGTDPAAIAAQINYLQQLLDHVNPYTGVALKDEPAILFIELVNEPWHHPDDPAGSVRYINALTDAVRRTGCRKLIFYNVSQDFRVGEAIRQSRAQGVTFGWYPSGLNSGHELQGNFLRAVDDYPDMRSATLAGMPRIVYEFDTPDLRTGYLYPAMARTFRSVGAQFASMFAYDMLATADRNLGWQTHYLNLVFTPRKAMSAVIAAEAMRRLPRGTSYGSYPDNTRFGDFHVDYDQNLGELVTRDAFLYAGSTGAAPPSPGELTRIAGYGSSSTVAYGGTGIYFLNRIRTGLWRLEVYPDAVPVQDPFEPPRADRIVTRAISRSWPMTVTLPDLDGGFTVEPLTLGNSSSSVAVAGRFMVRPGVYLLSASGQVDPATLPGMIGRIGLREYHPPPRDTVAPVVASLAPPALVEGRDARIEVRVVDLEPPDSVVLFLGPTAGGFLRPFPMSAATGYTYAATVPAKDLHAGPAHFVVSIYRGDSALTFPGASRGRPYDWNFESRGSWPIAIVDSTTPLTLFDPGSDAGGLAFSRIGDAGRRGLFRLGYSSVSGAPLLHFSLPVGRDGALLPDYTASLVVRDRIRARGESLRRATAIRLRARAFAPNEWLHLTLMEDDGTSWTAAIPLDTTWSEPVIPLAKLVSGRGVLLPEGFPGEWNYWVGPARGRGGPGDHLRVDHIERLELSLRGEEGMTVTRDGYGVEIEWVRLAED